jgi:hypothetical protein
VSAPQKAISKLNPGVAGNAAGIQNSDSLLAGPQRGESSKVNQRALIGVSRKRSPSTVTPSQFSTKVFDQNAAIDALPDRDDHFPAA